MPAPLKVAVVRPYFTFRKGGAERYAVELVRGLIGAGHEVHVYAHAWDDPKEPGVSYHHVPMPRKPAWLRVVAFDYNLRRRLRFSDYDAVLGLTPFWPQNVCWLGDGLYKVWVRIAWPVALVRWVMCFKRAVMAVNLRLERKMLTEATARFIANSQLVARQAEKYYGVPGHRIEVIYPCIDGRRFNPEVRARWRDEMRRTLGVGSDELVLLFVSNNFQRKGLDVALRALARVDRAKAPVWLIVVGAGRIASFRRMARRLGLADRISFVGATTEIERYYAAADVFILPTQYDPCATVCLEAMACGLPVITTSMNGAAEFIEERENGFVVDRNNPEDSVARYVELLSSDEPWARMGERAVQRVSHLSGTDHLRRVVSVLAGAAQSRRCPAVLPLAPDLIVNQEFLPLLARHRLTSFTALFATKMGTEITYNREKRIVLLHLDNNEKEYLFFLKRHLHHASLGERIGIMLGSRSATAAIQEWENIVKFLQAGLPTVSPVAAGARLLPDGRRESFVMTLGLEGYLPLDKYITERCAPPLSADKLRRKNLLIKALAELTRQMHGAMFNHRDFYLCHIFVREAENERPDLRIIDLERVGDRLFPVRRWVIKDLAQLHFSSLAVPLTDWDRLRFFADYCRGQYSRSLRRSLMTRILKKSKAIAKHDAKREGRDPRQRFVDPFDVSVRLGKSLSQHEADIRK